MSAQFHRDPVSAVESYHQDDLVIILPGVYSVSSTIVLPDSITIEGETSPPAVFCFCPSCLWCAAVQGSEPIETPFTCCQCCSFHLTRPVCVDRCHLACLFTRLWISGWCGDWEEKQGRLLCGVHRGRRQTAEHQVHPARRDWGHPVWVHAKPGPVRVGSHVSSVMFYIVIERASERDTHTPVLYLNCTRSLSFLFLAYRFRSPIHFIVRLA